MTSASVTDEEEADEEDEEEDYEESGQGNRLLGFMFGNVDNSGDLDVDYLDEDAKEHLAALADKLGSSLKDIDLSIKSTQLPPDSAEQDYDEKAEDAVDYEDIDEQYEGPEIHGLGEEDHLLPKKEFFSSHSLAKESKSLSAFDDENYDDVGEEEDDAKEHVATERTEMLSASCSGSDNASVLHIDPQNDLLASSNEDLIIEGTQSFAAEKETVILQDDFPEADFGPLNNRVKGPSPLPVLCIENGMVILRFSEIFGIQKSSKKVEKSEQRYNIYKERYKMENSYFVEEDDEIFLRNRGSLISKESADPEDSSPEFATFGDERDKLELFSMTKQRMKCFASAEPLREDSAFVHPTGFQSFCATVYPLDQLDWEDQIEWGNSPTVSGDSVESYESCRGSSGISSRKDSEMPLPETGMDSYANTCGKHQLVAHAVLESFDRDYSLIDRAPAESNGHPQLVRLEYQMEDGCENYESKASKAFCFDDTIWYSSNHTLDSKDVSEWRWMDEIIWDQKPKSKPKRTLAVQNGQMFFHSVSGHLRLDAGAAAITSPPARPRGAGETPGEGYQPGWQFNIANDKFYVKGKSTQQLQLNSSKGCAYGAKVHHSAPAIKLQTMKHKLSNKDLANFHRPKAVWYPHDIEVTVKEQEKHSASGAMKIILKSLGGKGSKLHVNQDETVSSLKAKAAKKLDFKLSEEVKICYLGKELEDDKSLAMEDVRPNSLLHLVRSRVHVMLRAQRIPGDNKSLRPPGAFKKKSDFSVKDGHVFLMEYCEERPLLLSNPGMGANLCSYYQKLSPGDQAAFSSAHGEPFGSVVSLEPSDKSPFIGDIRGGCRQSALLTNMYRAPVFPHRVPLTDFLLVRSSKGKLSLRRIDRIAVVGQQEPLMEVFSPGSKNVQAYLLNRLLVQVYRLFRDCEKRGVVPWIRVDELMALFPHLSESVLKKKLKECAVLRKDAKGHLHWCKKRDFAIPSEEELKKLVLPEHVCAYESMQAGLYHLKHMGITRITVPNGVSAAMSQLPDEAIALAAASHIERELQITPWSLSSNFVSCLNQDRDSIERLEITGVGDPSGRGLGFSYVRAAPKAPLSAAAKKKTAAARGGSTVTGTDADLRRLSMDAAREVLMKFNVPEEQIMKMTRWHRIAMIRKLSSEQAASDVKVDPTTISKYARGQRMSYLQLQQQTREKCQEIWDRQVQSLSAFDYDGAQSDSDENSDLDSFAGDLENLLDAEEFDGNAGNNESKHDKADCAKGLKMRRRPSVAQAEEEIEDEEAEAAELCRLLMDDYADHKKKKKAKAPTPVSKPAAAPKMMSNSFAAADSVKPVKKSALPSTFQIDPEEEKEVEATFLRRKSSEKKPNVKNEATNVTQITPRIKIVSENIKPHIFKEKKSARDSFVCGACGQLGHMKTNKHCPKYGEAPDPPIEGLDSEKNSVRSTSPNQSLKKRSAAVKAEPSESEKSIAKTKLMPLKINLEAEAGTAAHTKFTKIKISNKFRGGGDLQRTPSLVIRPPSETERTPSLIIKPPVSTKPSIVIRPPAEKEKEHSHKKIVIKKPKEIDPITLDEGSGFEYRKTKKIVELTGEDMRSKKKATRHEDEDGDRFAEIRRYEELIWSEREEEARMKAKKNKKKKAELGNEYAEEYKALRKAPERDRGVKRRAGADVGRYGDEESQAKRRRGGEVALANILEHIVNTLKSKTEVSYLFQKPVSKKVAPDYYDIIKRPMDLSTIREKVRKMEYRSREDFRHDVCQITINAHIYNDQRHPSIPPLADQLLELCDYLLSEHHQSLTDAEDNIDN